MKTGRFTRYVIASPDLSGRGNLICNNFQMPLRYLILTILFILLLSTTAFSYNIQVIGNIPLKDRLTGIGYHASGIVAVSSDTKTLYMIDIASKRVIKKISLSITPTAVVAEPNRNSAIISSKDGNIYFFELEKGNIVKTIIPHRHSALGAESIHSIALNPKTDTLYIGTTNGLLLMDLEIESIIKEVPLPFTPISMAIDPDLGYLLILMTSDTSHQQSELYIYNVTTLEPLIEVNVCGSPSLTPNSELFSFRHRRQPLNPHRSYHGRFRRYRHHYLTLTPL